MFLVPLIIFIIFIDICCFYLLSIYDIANKYTNYFNFYAHIYMIITVRNKLKIISIVINNMTNTCYLCDDIINVVNMPQTFILLCKQCLNTSSLCVSSSCKNYFMLSNTEMKSLQPVYTFKQIKNNTPKFYLESHVLNLLLSKNKNEQNLNTILNKKREKIITKKNKKTQIEDIRRNKIKYEFFMNKLEYNELGDVYSYVTIGKPSIKEIIHDNIIKLNKENNKRIKLSKYLENHGMTYNEHDLEHVKYIKQKNDTIKLSHYKQKNTRNEFIVYL